MQSFAILLLLSGAYPLWRAWRANRRTSLLYAIQWFTVSWGVWLVALSSEPSARGPAARAAYYVALALTGCAGVAVLGARRPGAPAWNGVVLALLAVDLLPLAQGLLTGSTLPFDLVRLLCVAATLAVGLLNYLPTRLAPAALCATVGFGLVMGFLVRPDWCERPGYLSSAWLTVGVLPWVAFLGVCTADVPASRFDRIWLAFWDRFGVVWGQRLREQFNRSALHAGWPVVLRWQGLRLRPGHVLPEPEVQEAMLTTLRALMKRFAADDPPSRT